MENKPCFLFNEILENIPRAKHADMPASARGLYVLYLDDEAVYVGMTSGKSGLRARLKVHHKNAWGRLPEWTHFTFFGVWNNLDSKTIRELEGMMLHFFCRKTSKLVNRSQKLAAFQKITVKSRAVKH